MSAPSPYEIRQRIQGLKEMRIINIAAIPATLMLAAAFHVQAGKIRNENDVLSRTDPGNPAIVLNIKKAQEKDAYAPVMGAFSLAFAFMVLAGNRKIKELESDLNKIIMPSQPRQTPKP